MFPNWKQVVQHAILELVAKTMEKFVMPSLESCTHHCKHIGMFC
jgi:hypothetical protein